jgi:hypothetical protein
VEWRASDGIEVIDVGVMKEDPYLTFALGEAHHGGELSALDGVYDLGELADSFAGPHEPAAAAADELRALAGQVAADVPEVLPFVLAGGRDDPRAQLRALAVLLRFRAAYGPFAYGQALAGRGMAAVDRIASAASPAIEQLLVDTFFVAYVGGRAAATDIDVLDEFLTDRTRALVDVVAARMTEE